MKKRLVIFFLAAAMVLGGCENKNSKLYKKGIEALEQLRALWHGYRINVLISNHLPMPGVDTPEDAAQMQQCFRSS